MTQDSQLAARSVYAAIWVLVFNFIRQAAGLVFGVIMARLLTPNEFGIVAICALYYALGNLFVDGGFGIVLIKKKDLQAADISTVFVYNITLALICSVLMALMARPLARFYDIPALSSIVFAYALLLPIGALGSVPRSLLYRELKQRILCIGDLIGFIFGALAGIIFALCGYGITALVAQTVTTTVIVTLFLLFCTPWRPRFSFYKRSFYEMFKTGSYIFATNFLDVLFLNIYNLWIGRIYSPDSLGYYTRGRDYAFFIVNQVSEIGSRIGLPALAKLQDDPAALRDSFLKMLAVLETVFWFPAFLLFTLAEPIIQYFLTDKWLPTVPYWRLFLLMVAFSPLLFLCQQGLIARNRLGRFFSVSAISKTFHLINIGVSFYISLYFLTAGQVVIFAVNTLIAFYLLHQEIKCSFFDILRVSLPALLLTGLSCFAAWEVYMFLESVSLFLSLMTASITAVLFFWVLNRHFCTMGYISVTEIILVKNEFLLKYGGWLLRKRK